MVRRDSNTDTHQIDQETSQPSTANSTRRHEVSLSQALNPKRQQGDHLQVI